MPFHHAWRFLLYAAFTTQHVALSTAFRCRFQVNSSRSLLAFHHSSPCARTKIQTTSMIGSNNLFCRLTTPKLSRTKDSTELMMARRWKFTDSEDGSNHDTKDQEVEQRTMEWIQKVVIGLKLCPFAEKPVSQSATENRKFQILVIRGKDENKIASVILSEMLRLLVSSGSTSVIVTPEFHPTDFGLFLDYIAFVEDLFLNNKQSDESRLINRQIQIAPFHPKFQFEGSSFEDITNYTNKSPYPMFHILREQDVTYASQHLGGDASQVWGRNVDLLERMEEVLGRDTVERVMNGENIEGISDFVTNFDNEED